MSDSDTTPPLRLMIVGAAGSGAGKSTVCLSLLGALLRDKGFRAEDLAYIKPCTQGVQQTLVAKWCHDRGVACRHVGPVVFFNGFTRQFLSGALDPDLYLDEDARATPPPSEGGEGRARLRALYTQRMQRRIRRSVEEIGRGKRLVLIDGVGYPGVGSICGVCNATVARLVGAQVLVVGKPGLGDCIDSFNVARGYMEGAEGPDGVAAAKESRVLGLLVNRVRKGGGAKKTAAVSLYFEPGSAASAQGYKLYGLVAEREELFAAHAAGAGGVGDAAYAAPGEHNQCSVTFGAPEPEQLAVEALTDAERAICDGLIDGFAEDVGMEKLRELVEDCGRR